MEGRQAQADVGGLPQYRGALTSFPLSLHLPLSSPLQ